MNTFLSEKRPILAALATFCFSVCACAHAQSSDSGPLATPLGELQFVRADHAFVSMLDKASFDRFNANTLTHFDETDNARGAVTRSLVQADSGPVLYDFRRRPPLVQRVHERIAVKRVFWQGDEVVMQGPQGWFSFKGGVLTRLQSSKKIYH